MADWARRSSAGAIAVRPRLRGVLFAYPPHAAAERTQQGCNVDHSRRVLFARQDRTATVAPVVVDRRIVADEGKQASLLITVPQHVVSH